MPGHQRPLGRSARPGQITRALRLVWVSVVFGILSGAVSVAAGLASHSLSVLAVGLGVLAHVTGSATLIWRFQVERRRRRNRRGRKCRLPSWWLPNPPRLDRHGRPGVDNLAIFLHGHGIDGFKPDVVLVRSVSKTLGRPVSANETERLLAGVLTFLQHDNPS